MASLIKKEAMDKLEKKLFGKKVDAKVGNKEVKAQTVVIAKADKSKQKKVPKNVFGRSKSNFVCMNYVANLSFDTGSPSTANTLAAQKSFRLNNINLPFIGQAADFPLPQGYTQAAQAFARFKVYAIRIRAKFYDASADMNVGLMTVSSTDTNELQAQITSKADMRLGTVIQPLTLEGENTVVNINRYIKISAIEGLTKDQFNSDFALYSQIFQNSVATAATDEAGTTGDLIKKRVPKLHLAAASLDTSQATCKCQIQLDYYVKVWGKTTLPTSLSAE